ncbi:cytochrome c oxidase subunit II [Rugamonas apoptosis]|uniref:cytochrome-c oxidase n=1 Tax=Rugamonas apoptosis TaxID=2758570 RepID=A0A7W2IKE9_9BURK|nr:cytochrome c oxidase subunit II [Rugamonas apoptosis]MBA5687705.1 cytochrome c oxidase subunit II [Rugamonas apoptosis]
MALPWVLILIVAGAVAFHLASPWWQTPVASNWQQMDDALILTLLITAVAFVAINLFLAYVVWRFRHRDGVRAAAEHGSKALEAWLVGLTTVAIIALLAPGLSVYAKLIHPPADAMVFEVLGQQWQWHYRLPGKDGKLGLTDVRYMSAANPFGINPDDPNGQDDVLVDGQEIHIPLNRPVKVMLRSQDVLHDFFVPQFRTRMNMVPGMVTSFWFTPMKPGRFEVMCAQLCGIGHYNMRSYVVVEPADAYARWLATQPLFAARAAAPVPAGSVSALVAGVDPGHQGRLLAQARGCVACHSADGSAGVGPSWKGLYGRLETMDDGKTVKADEAYLKQSITDPRARLVKGYPPVMPQQQFSGADLDALLAYIKSLGGPAPQ